MSSVPFKYLTLDQIREFVHANEILLVLNKMPAKAKQELAGLSLHGSAKDQKDYRSHLEYITRGGYPAEYDNVHVRRGMEKLGLVAELEASSEAGAAEVEPTPTEDEPSSQSKSSPLA